MPGFTSPQNFPYPLYTDPAGSGPAQIQALAEAIDDAIVAQQASITATVDRKRAAVSSAVIQSIPNNTATNGTFANEDLDNDNMVNLGVDNTAITVQTAGLYLVTAEANFVANNTGSRQISITLAGVNVGALRSMATNSFNTQINCAMLVYATVGQILRLSLLQNSGGALNCDVRKMSASRLSG